MTEYQKKKLIDLALVIIGIVLVGLFLRTQLSNPIVLEVDETETLIGDYVIGELFEDEEDTSLPEYVDIIASEIRIDNDYIDILVTLRGLAEPLPIESSDLKYSIFFDVSRDGSVSDDVIITCENLITAGSDESLFETKIIQMDDDVEKVLGAGEAVIDGNILYIRIPNSGKLEINDETPFKVWVSNVQKDRIYEDKMPSYSGE